MRVLSIAVLALLALGCGSFKRASAQITGYSKQCVEGVSYIQFSSGVTVQYDQEGKVVRCGS